MRRPALLALAASVVAVGVLAAWAGLNGPPGAVGRSSSDSGAARLVVPPPDNGVEQVLQVGIGPEVVAGDMFFCLDRPGEIVVDGVEPIGDLKMTNFAIRPNPSLSGGTFAGTQKGTFETTEIVHDDRPLTAVCSPGTGRGYELVT